MGTGPALLAGPVQPARSSHASSSRFWEANDGSRTRDRRTRKDFGVFQLLVAVRGENLRESELRPSLLRRADALEIGEVAKLLFSVPDSA
jgi:hypothetical protein